jgi:hypothetical protein
LTSKDSRFFYYQNSSVRTIGTQGPFTCFWVFYLLEPLVYKAKRLSGTFPIIRIHLLET